mmetsp:Transcript_7359/g.13585  ORF Transcript_7359/g.13585 Transcript_7359/m.13585 type:complete len:312 (-) Transcript_7359:132-1067(-)
MASTSTVDLITFGIVPGIPVFDKSGMQGGNVFQWTTGSPDVAAVYQEGLISVAEAACSMLMLHTLRGHLRTHSPPSAAVPQQLQPPTLVKRMHLTRGFMQGVAQRLPYQMFVVTALMAFAGLCCASWGGRLTGAAKRRKRRNQLKSEKKNKFEDRFLPLKYQEHENLDAEPGVRNWWSSKAGTDLGRISSDCSFKSQGNSSMLTHGPRPLVHAKNVLPKLPVASATHEPEEEDVVGNGHGPIPGTVGFVAEQTAEVERALEIFRMCTEGSVQLVDEDRIYEMIRESQVVPDGIVRSCAVDLERRIDRSQHC